MKKVGYGLILLMVASLAKAEIRIIYDYQPENVEVDYKLAVDGTVKVLYHIGEMPGELPGIATRGEDRPFTVAFDEIIPLDWKVYVHHSLDDERLVSWDSEGENWITTIYRLGMEYEYSFDVNWDMQWVLVNKSQKRYQLSQSDNPEIEVKGYLVEPGKLGEIYIDGKIIPVRSKARPK